MIWKMPRRLLVGMILGIGLAGCGDDDSSTSSGRGGVPDFATVKRLALGTRPLKNECREGTKDEQVLSTDDEPRMTNDSKQLRCASHTPPAVGYLVFHTEADADRAIRHRQLDYGASPYFVNRTTVVYVLDSAPGVKPSPLAQQIKDECGCGEVHKAGKRFK
jgi:hypothetical protein